MTSLLRRFGLGTKVSSYPARSYGLSTFARDKSSHRVSSSRQHVTIVGDGSSEEHIVGKSGWPAQGGDNGITKTTTVGITYDNFFAADKP
jgi:hypothetical protein